MPDTVLHPVFQQGASFFVCCALYCFEKGGMRLMLRHIALLCLLPLLLCSACGEPVPEESSSLEESSAPQRITTIYPTWSTDDIYTAGDIVVHNGGYYRALWWSRGNEPTADTERDEWQYLGEVPVTGAYFNDVPDSTWYAEAINTLAEAGIVTGAGSGNNFYPSRPITRAQFSVLLCRALGIEPIESSDSFTDAADAWYTPYLAALKQRGIAQGGDDNLFRPEQPITRQELCCLIYNASDGFAEDPDTALAPYSDREMVASWAVQALSWCVERGIVEGNGRKLLPDATASRAEAAQIIYNLLQRAQS